MLVGNEGAIVPRNEGAIVPRNEGQIALNNAANIMKLPTEGYRIISRLSPQTNLSGEPYSVSDAFANNLGVSTTNPIISRLANATTVVALPIAVTAATGNNIGLATRHLMSLTSNTMRTTSHLIRTATELVRGNRSEAGQHAALASSHAFSAIINGTVASGVYLLPELWMIESTAAVLAPSLSRSLFNTVSDAPNSILARTFGIAKPFLLIFSNGRFPITAQEKNKIKQGVLNHYRLLPNEANNGFDIDLLSEDAAKEIREEAPAIEAPAIEAAPRERALPAAPVVVEAPRSRALPAVPRKAKDLPKPPARRSNRKRISAAKQAPVSNKRPRSDAREGTRKSPRLNK